MVQTVLGAADCSQAIEKHSAFIESEGSLPCSYLATGHLPTFRMYLLPS